MILLFKIILLTSIWCLGIKIVTSEGMGLERLRIYAKQQIDNGKIVWEALIYCEWCLPSIHSVFGYAFALVLGIINSFSWKLVFMYPLVVAGSSIICGLTWALYKTINSQKDVNESVTDAANIFIESIIAHDEETQEEYENRMLHTQKN
jgi:hypothetical protein